ncbi:hypothetical protein D9M71_654310 [compost metagenome]
MAERDAQPCPAPRSCDRWGAGTRCARQDRSCGDGVGREQCGRSAVCRGRWRSARLLAASTGGAELECRLWRLHDDPQGGLRRPGRSGRCALREWTGDARPMLVGSPAGVSGGLDASCYIALPSPRIASASMRRNAGAGRHVLRALAAGGGTRSCLQP